jgi:hypothetical protein
MIAAGYMGKVVAPRPQWVQADNVTRIYSVSNCVSHAFCNYINHWKHNGYWFFDSPSAIREIAKSDSTAAKQYEVLYYELFELQFDEGREIWEPFQPEPSFRTEVRMPEYLDILGFDVVSYSVKTSPECSPLSCNNLVEKIKVNKCCLLSTLDEAKKLLESGAFTGSEPGPFRIAAVYRTTQA